MSEFRTALDSLDRLGAELEQLRARREKIEERRSEVRPETYNKLTAEYEEKIAEAEKTRDAAADTLRRDLASLKSELEALAAEADQADQAIEELELRRYIGEYSEEDFAALHESEKAKRDTIGSRLEDLRRQVDGAEKVLGTGEGPGTNGQPPPITDTQPLPKAVTPPPDSTNPGTAPPAPAPDETVDLRHADELSSTVAVSGNAGHQPVFGDADDFEAGGDTGLVTVGGEEAPPAAVTLNYLDETREVPIDGFPFTIGRSTKNTLSLKSEEISRYHAQIRFEKGKFVLEDLGSANGTKLDGKRVQRAELEEGGRIVLGPAELTFVLR